MGLMDAIKDFFNPPKPGDPPSWAGRIKKASYKSPSGQVVPFDFADLEEAFEKKTTAFESANADGTYVQDRGKTSGRFPMAVAIAGDNYDQRANAFMAALLERGEGTLNHPLHGPITVVPFGEIARADNLVSGAGQALFTVTFYETTGLQIGGSGGVPQLFDSFCNASAVDFADKVNVKDASDFANFVTKAKAIIKKVKAVMLKISDGQALLQKTVEGIGDSMNRGIDLLVGQPLMLARQTQILLGEPARQAKSMKAKLAGYGDLASQLFEQVFGESAHEKTADKNNFHLAKLNAGSAVAASALSVHATIKAPAQTNAELLPEVRTRAGLVRAAIQLQESLDAYQEWHDASYTALAEAEVNVSATDTGDGQGELVNLITAAMSEAIQASFGAVTEYRFILDRDRTPLDLAFEYDTDFNFFCASNDLSGDELFIIPKGTEIVRYL